ncbi:MAG: phage portal protein [Phycisphaerales bacterium]|nr:phage portal protein [Phycisphaerales bacterium]
MSVLGAILGLNPRAESVADDSSADPWDRPEFWTGGQSLITSAGELVGPERSLSLSTYYACLKILAEDVAKVGWHLYERGQGGRRRADTDPRYWLVHDEPGGPDGEVSDFTFRETLVYWAAGWGHAEAEIIRDGRGMPTGMELIHPSRVTERRTDSGALVYDIRRDSAQNFRPLMGAQAGTVEATLPAENVFQLKNFGGLSVARLAAETIGHALAVRRFGAAFFGNGTVLGGWLEHPAKLNPEARKTLKQLWADRYQGPGKAHKTALLEEGVQFHPLAVPPESAQFVETMRFTVPEVCNWFRVPMYKLNLLDGVPKANIEQLSLDYVGDTVQTWTTRLDKEGNRKLLFERERRVFYFEHNLDSLKRADLAARGEYYKTAIANGWMTINEVRALQNLDGIGPAGDQAFVPLNQTTAERVLNGEPPPNASKAGPDAAAADLDFKRQVVKQLIADGTIGDVIFNLTDGKRLLADVNLPVASGSPEEPWLPVVAASGPLVSGETIEDPQGDVVGGDVVGDDLGDAEGGGAGGGGDGEPTNDQHAAPSSGAGAGGAGVNDAPGPSAHPDPNQDPNSGPNSGQAHRTAALKATARLFAAGAERSLAKLRNAAERKSRLEPAAFAAWAEGQAEGLGADLAANLEAAAETLLELLGGPEFLVRERKSALERMRGALAACASAIVAGLATGGTTARGAWAAWPGRLALVAQGEVVGSGELGERGRRKEARRTGKA